MDLPEKENEKAEEGEVEVEKGNKKLKMGTPLLKAILAHRSGDVHIDIMSHDNSPMGSDEE